VKTCQGNLEFPLLSNSITLQENNFMSLVYELETNSLYHSCLSKTATALAAKSETG